MRTIFLAVVLLIPMFMTAQNCKPDLDKSDKITRKENKAWESIIYESGFGNSLINTSDWRLKLQFGRYGAQNMVTLFLEKIEESAQNSSFESQYKGEKGREYFFAFSQGEPIKLIVQATTTASKMDNLFGKLVTTVTLTSVLTDNNIEDFKSHFDNGSLSAVRVSMAGDLKFEKEVKDKKATTAKEKFTCFYDFNSNNKIIVPDEPELNNLPPNPNVPEIMPRDATTEKVSFTDVVTVSDATKDQLFNRAKSWMTNYYKNEQFAINNKEEGRLTREGMFAKTYNQGNGKTSTDKHNYNISVFIKDGKYKYEITDLVANDGKELEKVYEMLQVINRPKLIRYVNQQIYEGVEEVVKSLKAAMLVDPKSKTDW